MAGSHPHNTLLESHASLVLHLPSQPLHTRGPLHGLDAGHWGHGHQQVGTNSNLFIHRGSQSHNKSIMYLGYNLAYVFHQYYRFALNKFFFNAEFASVTICGIS